MELTSKQIRENQRDLEVLQRLESEYVEGVNPTLTPPYTTEKVQQFNRECEEFTNMKKTAK